MAKDVVAIICSDIHLSHTPPIARSAEPDWYEAQGNVLSQLREIQEEHKVPILCAGDVFDKYNPPPELINWAIDHLPHMWSVAGQHDLPYHNYTQVHRSVYETMVKANIISMAWAWDTYYFSAESNHPEFSVAAFSWGQDIVYTKSNDDDLQVCIAHKYVWTKGCGYPGAPVGDLAGNMADQLKGFDTAIFGDNHRAFTTKAGDCVVRNCGCLIPRKQDERDLLIEVGLLLEDGSIETVTLDTSKDKWIEPDDMPKEFDVSGMEEFINELKDSETEDMDYKEAVERFIHDHKVRKPTANILFKALEGV